MAAFSASNLVNAQLILAENATKAEMREQVLPSLKLGLSQSNQGYFFEDPIAARKREDRTVNAYYAKRRTASVTSTRTATHTGSREDSASITLSWTTYTRTFSTSLKQFDNNVMTYEMGFIQGIKNAILDIHAQIETDTIANLLTYKTHVVQSNSNVGSRCVWNSTNYAYEIASGDANNFFVLAKTAMVLNKYQDASFDVIADGNVYSNSRWYQNQGTGNATNTAFQFAGMNPMISPNLSDSNYTNGVSLVMQKGSYCLLPWIPKQNRTGYGDYSSYNGGYGMLADPLGLGLDYAVHIYEYRTDTSSYNGVAQDNQIEVEISVDVAFVPQPISVSNEYSIYEFAQL